MLFSSVLDSLARAFGAYELPITLPTNFAMNGKISETLYSCY